MRQPVLAALSPGPYTEMLEKAATSTMVIFLAQPEPRRNNIQVTHTVHPVSQK